VTLVPDDELVLVGNLRSRHRLDLVVTRILKKLGDQLYDLSFRRELVYYHFAVQFQRVTDARITSAFRAEALKTSKFADRNHFNTFSFLEFIALRLLTSDTKNAGKLFKDFTHFFH
jgi:hypothetical protein